MHRRSSSSSQIPIPRTLFNNDSSRKRSASSARLSQRSSVSTTAKPREKSPEAKISLNRLSRQTPLNNLKRGRSSSAQRTPYSDPRGRSATRGNSSSALRSQEKATIQKLSSNITWVSEQYAKVRNFIATSGLFDPAFQADCTIKPPSIKTFIHITLVLMKQIFHNVDFNQQNYKEEITKKLKILKYPGTLAMSVLKTVNTIHSWPQVIGMFGWLIDKVDLITEIPNIDLDKLEPEDRTKYQITQICKEYVLQRYSIFNSGNNEERISEANNQYITNLSETLAVKREDYEQLVSEVEKNSEYKLKLDKEITMLSEEIKSLELERDQLQKEMDEIEEIDVVKEATLDGEIKFLNDKTKRILERKTPLIESISQLKEMLKTQKCTYQEKVALAKTVEFLSNDVKTKREKLEHAQKLQQQFDGMLNDERHKLHAKVARWNKFLMEWAIRKPQLKSLLLNETGLHNSSYLESIKEVLKQKNTIEKNLAKELEELSNELNNKKALHKKLESNLQELTNAVDELTLEYTKTQKSAERIEEQLSTLESEWDLAKKDFAQEMIAVSKKYDVEALKNLALSLKLKKESLEKEVNDFAIKILTFFVDLHNQVGKDLKEMESIRTKVILEKMRSLRDKQLEVFKKYNQL